MQEEKCLVGGEKRGVIVTVKRGKAELKRGGAGQGPPAAAASPRKKRWVTCVQQTVLGERHDSFIKKGSKNFVGKIARRGEV